MVYRGLFALTLTALIATVVMLMKKLRGTGGPGA
jgi:hypothetical protein